MFVYGNGGKRITFTLCTEMVVGSWSFLLGGLLGGVICLINSVIEFSFRTLTAHQIRHNDPTRSPHQPLDAELNVV